MYAIRKQCLMLLCIKCYFTFQSLVKESAAGFDHIVWTYSMRRIAVMVGQALKFGEPVLLVGDTG